MLRPRTLSILKFSTTIGLLVFLITKIDIPSFLDAIKRVNIFLFGIALLISAFAIVIRSFKWQLLLRIQGAKLSLAKINSLNYMALFFNNFFLGSFGGDGFRIYRTIDYPKSGSGAISSVIMEKLTNVLSLIILIVIFGIVNLYKSNLLLTGDNLYRLIGLTLSICVLFCISCWILFYKTYERKLGDQKIVGNIIQNFVESMRVYKKCPRIIILSMVLSFGFYATNIVSMYVLGLTANIKVSLIDFAFIVPTVFLVVMIPISVNGIGLQEGAFFFYFDMIGIDPSSALIIAVLPRIGMLLFSLIGGFLFMREGWTPKKEAVAVNQKKDAARNYNTRRGRGLEFKDWI